MKFKIRWICKKAGGLALGFNYHFPMRVIHGYYSNGEYYNYWSLVLNFLVFAIEISNSKEGN